MDESATEKPKYTDPVHQDLHDLQWYFWDETWADRNGPYESEAIARQKLIEYADWLTHGPRPTIANVQVSPVQVTLQFASVEHLEAVVASMAYYADLPLPPEVTTTKVHSQNHVVMETLRDTYRECLVAYHGNRGLVLGPHFGKGGSVNAEKGT